MFIKLSLYFCLFVSISASVFSESKSDSYGCYWNNHCAYQLFGSKTPYDAIRGDIRDFRKPQGCEAVSFWSLHRHGNRNPDNTVTEGMIHVSLLKDQIVAAYDEGTSQLCAQDIDEFRKFIWNETIEVSQSFLTGIGYEELYDIGRRVRLVYPELLNGSEDDYYFRPTNEQRTITSAMAFVHGLTDETNLTLVIDGVREVEDVVKPYLHCDRYQELVKVAPAVTNEVEDFQNSSEYQAIRVAVQQRLGISYQMNNTDVYYFYELCRFYRSWVVNYRSPWCSVFTDEELVVLEYADDVRHYYRNGYGSWVNTHLGRLPLKALYENMEAAVQGRGKKVISYFTHDTMMEMVWCALGLYKDPEPLRGVYRNENRVWRSSHMSSLAVNMMAVLNSCQDSGIQSYRIQLFIGEKPSDLCPLEGCTWEQFQEIFQPFSDANLEFCSLDRPEFDFVTDNAISHGISWLAIIFVLLRYL